MFVLITGLGLFFVVHLVPNFTSLHRHLVGRFGENEYKFGTGVLTLVAFGLIVIGMRDIPYAQVWLPPVWLHLFVLPLLFVAFFFIASSFVPSNMPRLVGQPIYIGIILFSVAHLLVNDDLGSIILFASFLVFSVLHIFLANQRGVKRSTRRYPFRLETMPVAVGGVLLIVSFLLHARLIGVPPGIH
ncbi:MAG: NnrU family protein [Pseudomonadota bacterium]